MAVAALCEASPLHATTNEFGIMLRYAGGGTNIDNGILATNAMLVDPTSLTVDGDGNLYFADLPEFGAYSVIRRVDAVTRQISTIAGTGTVGDTGDGGPATSANITVTGIALDSSGLNLYFSCGPYMRIRKVHLPSGIVSGVVGFPQVLGPIGLAMSSDDELFMADPAIGVLKLPAGSDTVMTVARLSWDGGVIESPSQVALDRHGNVFVLDTSIHGSGDTGIWRIDGSNHSNLTHVAGGGAGPGTSGHPTNAFFRRCFFMALDDHGGVYAAGAHRIWRADMITQTIASFAGDGIGGEFSGEGGPAQDAQFHFVTGIAMSKQGDVFIADGPATNRLILRVSRNLLVDDPASQIYLGSQTNVNGSVVVNGTTLTNLDACQLELLQGHLTISSNEHLASICASNLNTVTGNLTIVDNPNATQVDVGNPTAIHGDLSIQENGPGTVVDVGNPVIGGDLTIENNGDGTIVNVGDPESAGDLTIEGDLTIIGNDSQVAVNVGNPTPVGGNLTIQENGPGVLVNVGNVNAVDGNLTIENNGPGTIVDVNNVAEVGGSLTISNDSSVFIVNVNSLTNAGSNFTISANPNLTNVSVIALSSVGGDFTVSENHSLESIKADALATVGGGFTITDSTANTILFGELAETGGDLVLSNNPAADEICFTNLTRVGGRFLISRTGPAATLCFDRLTNVVSDFEISDATANTVLFSELETVGGNLTITDTTANTIVLGELDDVGGSVIVVENSEVGSLNLGNLESTTGDIVVTDNPGLGSLDLGGLIAVGGSIVVTEDPGLNTLDLASVVDVGGDIIVTGDTNLSNLVLGEVTVGGDIIVETSEQGTLDLSGAMAAGVVSITGEGATTISAQTGGKSTSVTFINGSAAMTAQLPDGTFDTNVSFTVAQLAPAALPDTGTTFSGTTVAVDAVAAYQFTFAVPTLNQDAALTFDIAVASLPDPPAFLAALNASRVTLAVAGDAPGSPLQLFDVCPANQPPVTDTCARITRLDANGLPLPPGSPVAPTTVRVEGVVGHFSTYAVVTFQPLGELTITGPVASDGAFSFSFASQAGTNYTVQFTDSLQPVNWQTLTNLSGTGALLPVTDEPLTNAQRFYRVQVVP